MVSMPHWGVLEVQRSAVLQSPLGFGVPDLVPETLRRLAVA